MKKYLWIVALVAALAMAFVGCDGGDSGSGGDVTISFNVNKPAGYEGPNLSSVDPVTIKNGAAIGALPAKPAGGDDSIVFLGWFSAASGGNQITAATTFTKSTTVYAHWQLVDETDVEMTFKLNYPDAPADIIKIGKSGQAMGAEWPADPTRPGTVQGNLNDNDTWAFIGWKQYEGGSGDDYTKDTVLPGSIIDNTVWAKWEPSTGNPTDVAPDGIDLAGAEKVLLDNAWFLPYYFELPSGKTFSDYAEITFDIMVGPLTLIRSNSCRTLRLMGNYVPADFDLEVPNSPSIGNYPDGMMIASYNNGKNAEYIMNNVPDTSYKTIETVLTQLGLNATAWVWNTVHHKIDASDAHANFQAKNLPAGTDTGPFIFGVGIPGEGGGGSLQWIRNVRLVGNSGTASVTAKPLWFSKDGKTHPAFNGYPTKDGTSGFKEAYRGMVDGSQPTPVAK
jgi:hypothetical protein